MNKLKFIRVQVKIKDELLFTIIIIKTHPHQAYRGVED